MKFLGLSLVFATISLIPAPSFAGGGSGSSVGRGGSVIRVSKEKSMLLELFLASPNSDDGNSVGKPLTVTPFAAGAKFDVLILENLDATRIAFDRLKLWSVKTPALSRLIRETIEGQIHFFYTFRKFRKYPDFFVPEAVANHDAIVAAVKTAIIFDPLLGPVVNGAQWNRLSEKSRAGLLIHEAFRHVQSLSGGTITDESIQEMTSRLMLEDPSAGAEVGSERQLGKDLFDVLNTFANTSDDLPTVVQIKSLLRRASVVIPRIQAAVAADPLSQAWYDNRWKDLLADCGSYFTINAHELTEEEQMCAFGLIFDPDDNLPEPAEPIPSLMAQLVLRGSYIEWMHEFDVKRPFDGAAFYVGIFLNIYHRYPEPGETLNMVAPWLTRNYLNGTLSPEESAVVAEYGVRIENSMKSTAPRLGAWMDLYFKESVDAP